MLMDRQLRIAVCDDEQTDRARITELTEQILQSEKILYTISCYESAKQLLDDIQKGAQFHILLSDVMMDDMDGMELAGTLREQENKTTVIFISSNREMALRGYEVSALRYLAKPVDRDKLEEALLCGYRRWQEKKEILLPTKQGQHRISFADIQFVEAVDRGARFVLINESVDTKIKFSEAEAMLPKSAFILCHRAYIANIAHVKRIRPREFEMRSGELVPISKYRYDEVSKKFFNYITD